MYKKAFTLLITFYLGVTTAAASTRMGGDLLIAATNGHRNKVSEIVNRIKDDDPYDIINIRYSDGLTPLIWAASNGHSGCVAILLSHSKININYQDTQGLTALIWAAYNGHAKVIIQLCSHSNLDPNLIDNEGYTALMNAVMQNRSECTAEILKHPKTNPNLQRAKDGKTALMYAAEYGHHLCLAHLIKHPKININLSDKQNKTALLLAITNGYAKCVALLLKSGNSALVQKNGDPILHLAVTCYMAAAKKSGMLAKAHKEVVLALLKDHRIDPRTPDARGKQAIDLLDDNSPLKPILSKAAQDYTTKPRTTYASTEETNNLPSNASNDTTLWRTMTIWSSTTFVVTFVPLQIYKSRKHRKHKRRKTLHKRTSPQSAKLKLKPKTNE